MDTRICVYSKPYQNIVIKDPHIILSHPAVPYCQENQAKYLWYFHKIKQGLILGVDNRYFFRNGCGFVAGK